MKPGPLDGEFGPRTAAACNHYKWRIGYPPGSCHPVAGGLLIEYLAGKRQPTARMRLRAAARRRKERQEHATQGKRRAMRLRALAIIKGEIGTKEQGENVIKYSRWWGWGAVAYCVIGISWAWIDPPLDLVVAPRPRLAGTADFGRGRHLQRALPQEHLRLELHKLSRSSDRARPAIAAASSRRPAALAVFSSRASDWSSATAIDVLKSSSMASSNRPSLRSWPRLGRLHVTQRVVDPLQRGIGLLELSSE